MKKRIEVLIADDNVEFGDILCEYLNQKEDICVVGVARDGKEAVEKVKSTQSDVMLLDIVMPNYDGLVVLEKIMSLDLEKKPSIIMLTAIGQDVFIKNAVKLGAEYYVIKPFDVDVLERRIREVFAERGKSSITRSGENLERIMSGQQNRAYNSNLVNRITDMIHEFGIPPHVAGYHYLREAVLMAVSLKKANCMVTKEIYPEIARKMNTTSQKVERSIRNAISNAWAHNGCNSGLFDSERPTNSKFILSLAKMLSTE